MIQTHLQFISPRFMLFLSLGSKHGGVNLLLLSYTRIYGKNVILFNWGKKKANYSITLANVRHILDVIIFR